MAHVALYREFRPQSFADVVSQEHVTKTLRNALIHNRLHHAYLLSGPRGTGKTSVARILAKAVNCTSRQNGEPCSQCEPCKRITSGRTMDIIEIDAASNRNIDDVRDLRDKVKYAPTDLTTKVYIIDEVHMLTEHAFNALLKTLEEPPGHTMFVLATTDPHKVPITITSRCQRFDFHRLAAKEIVGQLQEICERYQFPVTDEALGAIARQAEGGMRDALSLLDQVMAFADKEKGITLQDTLMVLGAVPLDQFLRLDGMLVAADVGGILLLIDELVLQGKDLRQFVRDYLAHLRDLLLFRVDPTGRVLDLPEQTITEIKRHAGEFDQPRILSAVKVLAQLEADLRFAASPRLLVEVALIRLCGFAKGEQEPAIPAREPSAPARKSEMQRPVPSPVVEPPLEPVPVAATNPSSQEEAPGALVPLGAGAERVNAVWSELLELVRQIRPNTRSLLDHAKVGGMRGNTLLLATTNQAFVKLINRAQDKSIVEKALVKLGLPMMEVLAVAEDDPALATARAGDTVAPSGAVANEGSDVVAHMEKLFGKEFVKVVKEDGSI